MISEAWAAGFFEGEGTIGLLARAKGRQRVLSVEISNTDREALVVFQERWGGQIYSYAGKKERSSPFFRWVIVAVGAAAFLRDIEPFVVRSRVRERIVVALEFQDSRRQDWSNRTMEYQKMTLQCIERLRVLNARGRTVLAGRFR